MEGIVATARQWLSSNIKDPGASPPSNEHIIDSLLAEIRRIESLNVALAEEIQRSGQTERRKSGFQQRKNAPLFAKQATT